jgi:hypothetical protein
MRGKRWKFWVDLAHQRSRKCEPQGGHHVPKPTNEENITPLDNFIVRVNK